MELFDHRDKSTAPLAERMRPRSLAEVVGQAHLVAEGALLEVAVRSGRVPSMVLWGPPGTGKTTLAHILAHESGARLVSFNAVLGGVPQLRKLLKEATEQRRLSSKPSLLFVDEIHRFNKAQQDALLPHVERGTVILVGATTENPSFAVNDALLSRARPFRLRPLSEEDVLSVLQRACEDKERGLGDKGLEYEDGALERMAAESDGDARHALTLLESVASYAEARGEPVSKEAIEQASATRALRYDRKGEGHYNTVSAFIKSLRGSDPDAALYYMARMLEGGEEPRFVVRRMLIFASEDIANADPRALELAIATSTAFERLGMPEAKFALAQCCVYLAVAPKSNSVYGAYDSAMAAVKERGSLEIPMHLRNAVTRHMKSEGYGEGYRYPHNEGGYSPGTQYLPKELEGQRFYEPTRSGFEAKIADRLEALRNADAKARAETDSDTEK